MKYCVPTFVRKYRKCSGWNYVWWSWVSRCELLHSVSLAISADLSMDIPATCQSSKIQTIPSCSNVFTLAWAAQCVGHCHITTQENIASWQSKSVCRPKWVMGFLWWYSNPLHICNVPIGWLSVVLMVTSMAIQNGLFKLPCNTIEWRLWLEHSLMINY